MERLVFQPHCGCQVYRIMHSKPNLYRIQYCPLHKSAPDLYEALKADEVGLWTVTNAIKEEIKSREWITEGRGSYAWDDERYRDETRLAFEAILKLLEQVQHPAQQRYFTALAKVEEKWN